MFPKMALGLLFVALITINAAYGAEYNCIKCENDPDCNDDDVSGVTTLLTENCGGTDLGCYTAKSGNVFIRGCAKSINELQNKTHNNQTIDVKKICATEKCNQDLSDVHLQCYTCEHCPNRKEANTISQNCKDTLLPICSTLVTEEGKVERGCSAYSSLQNGKKYKKLCAEDQCNDDTVDIKTYQCKKCEGMDECQNRAKEELCTSNDLGCYTLLDGEKIKRGCAKTKEDLNTYGQVAAKIDTCNSTNCNNDPFFTCLNCTNKECFEEVIGKEICTMKDKGCYTRMNGDEIERGCAKKNKEFKRKPTFCHEKDCNNAETYRCLECKDADCDQDEVHMKKTYCGHENKGCYTLIKEDTLREKGCVRSDLEWNRLKKRSNITEQTLCKKDLCNKDNGFTCYQCRGGDSTCNKDVITHEFALKHNIRTPQCFNENAGCYIAKKGNDIHRGCAQNVDKLKTLDQQGFEVISLCSEDKCNGKVPTKAVSDLECYVCKNCPHPESSNTLPERCSVKEEDQLICYTALENGNVRRGCSTINQIKTLLVNATEICSASKCNEKETNSQQTFNCQKCKDEECFNKDKEYELCGSDYDGCYTKIKDSQIEKGCVQYDTQVNDWINEGYSVTKRCKFDKCNDKKPYYCNSCKNDGCIFDNPMKNVTCAAEDKGCYTYSNGETVERGCANDKKTFPDNDLPNFTQEGQGNDLPVYRCFNCSGASCDTGNSTTYCTNENKGCYVFQQGETVTRGCARNESEWSELISKQGKLTTPCKKDLCNGKDPVIFRCIYCRGNGKCNDDDVSNVQDLEKEECNTNHVGCYTARKENTTDKAYYRGCAKTLEELKQNVTKDGLQILSICSGDNCNAQPAKQLVDECYMCEDCKNPMLENTKTVNCQVLKQGGQQVCYTKNSTTGAVSRGCIDSSLLTAQTVQDMIDICAYSQCNNKETGKITVSCYNCTDCDTIQDNTTVVPCKFTSDNAGCYMQIKKDSLIRGCAVNAQEFDKLKEEDAIVPPACQTDKCNNEETYKCYDCNDDKDCRDPKNHEDQVKSIRCPKISDAGCFWVPESNNTYRGCALNKEDAKKHNPHDVQLDDFCTTDLCNSKVKNSGLLASSSMLMVSIFTIGAYLANF